MNLTNTNEVFPPGVAQNDDAPVKEDHTMQITLNKQVLDVLRRYDLDINKLFVLLAIYDEANDLLDVYDEDLTKRKVLVEDYEFLRYHGFVQVASDKATEAYHIDEKGTRFVEQIRLLFEATEGEKAILGEFKKLCEDYLQLWPRIKLPSNVYARVSIVEIDKKMKAFYKTYKAAFKKEGITLTPRLILDATKTYIDRYAKDNYKFMVNSSYFIQKKEKSTLADEILAMTQGITKNKDPWTKLM